MSDRTTLRLTMTVWVHDFGLQCAPLFLYPLADPALGTDCRHDSATRNQQEFAKNNPKIFLLGHNKNWAK
jgi:hypothetical protein